MAENKLIKKVEEGFILTAFVAGIGFIGHKVIKKDLTGDPSKSLMNFAKMGAVITGSMMLHDYLLKEKYIPM